MKRVITLDKENHIYIAVYHLGYESQGEGSIFILYSEARNVLYSAVIDCFEEKQCNITDEVLKKWGLEVSLDLFIWTHPHDDHSIGIQKIIECYCDAKTRICLANVFNNASEFSEVSQNNIKYLRCLNYRKSAKNKWKINSLAHFPEILDERDFNGIENSIQKLIVQCISPIPEIGGMGANSRIDCNKIGIACIIKIEQKNENINFLFAGDMEKYTIEALIEEEDDSIPTVYNYIKIPHHGSRDAEKMIEFLKLGESIKSEFASTSVFKGKNLPEKEILKSYKTIVDDIACTSDIISGTYGKGVIRLVYDLTRQEVETTYFGTATSIAI